MNGYGARSLLGRATAALVLAVSVLVAGAAHADEPVAPEGDTNPNTRPGSHVQGNLILVGAAVTVGWYGVALGTSYLWSESDGASALRIPVAGPYMALAKTGCGEAELDCDTVAVVFRTALTVLSAVGQTGGLLVMGEGLFLPTAPRARRSARTENAWQLSRPRLTVTPVALGKTGYGLGLSASF